MHWDVFVPIVWHVSPCDIRMQFDVNNLDSRSDDQLPGGVVDGRVRDGVKTLAFMTGVFYFGMAVFGIGFIASFLAYPVLLGFTGGAALQIAASQLKYAFALNPHTTTWIDNVKLLQHWDSFNWKAFACCVATFTTLMTFKGIPKYFPNWKYSKIMKSTPMTLILVVFFTLINFGGRFLDHATKGNWNKGTLHAPEIIGEIVIRFPTKIDLDFSLVDRHPNIFLLQALSAAVVIFTTHIAG
ncbi:sulfate permease family [Reticulomyxa filosa]|uniref:Sulfate permease family n=1 Tax=Reticulomyxa filosa TaxID=46433 RepID=X6NZI0_RETFI|nr:sulfate permease family [Reticulomyxa filosa]|eukprot:ETO30697.1 sulfate permease family [Reticulomyxa filosa]